MPSMEVFYKLAGLSRQGFNKTLKTEIAKNELLDSLIEEAKEVRKNQGQMGCRKLYFCIRPQGIGRDTFERYLLENGLRIKKKRYFVKTTKACKRVEHPNLLKDSCLDGPYQAISTDITYQDTDRGFAYISTVIDIYTKEVLSIHAAKNMSANESVVALNKAMARIPKEFHRGIIHHTDRGTQYTSNEYQSVMRQYGLIPSHAKHGWQNPYSERINRTLKEEYLKCWEVKTFKQLEESLQLIKFLYNEHRPHWNVPGKLTPVHYRKMVLNTPQSDRKKLYGYNHPLRPKKRKVNVNLGN